jgi:FAD dependent oxidoreductase
MLDELTHPYQIPYGVIVPKLVDGLLVPVAASTTHVAFSTIRLEPTWMALGEAAGTAADLAIRDKVTVRAVDVTKLQFELLKQH